MGQDEKWEWMHRMDLSGASSAELRGRQSVRATFRLSSACIDAISLVARHLGIKQKSLFDHLAEDMDSLTSIAEASRTLSPAADRIQKTFVISRRSLSSLDEISKSYNTPRDILVECSVQRLLPLIESERMRQEKRKKMLGEMEAHFQKGVSLLARWESVLEGPDPFVESAAEVMAAYENVLKSLSVAVEQGKSIEMFEPDIFMKRFL